MIRDIRGRSDYGRLTLLLEHIMRDLLLLASLRVTRVVGPCAVLWLVAGYSAAAGAQPAATAPTDVLPCPKTAPDRGDDKQPCVAPSTTGGAPGAPAGAGGGAGGGAAGGGSQQNPNAPPEVLGPYRVVKVMDRAGEVVDRIVCSIAEPFVVHMQTRPATFDIKFEPADKSRGTWTYAYDIPRAGESHRAHGEHVVSAAAADGTRSLTIDGPDFVTFRGFAGPIEMHYVMGLAPVAAGGACGR